MLLGGKKEKENYKQIKEFEIKECESINQPGWRKSGKVNQSCCVPAGNLLSSSKISGKEKERNKSSHKYGIEIAGKIQWIDDANGGEIYLRPKWSKKGERKGVTSKKKKEATIEPEPEMEKEKVTILRGFRWHAGAKQ